jgi:hypothetical protein
MCGLKYEKISDEMSLSDEKNLLDNNGSILIDEIWCLRQISDLSLANGLINYGLMLMKNIANRRTYRPHKAIPNKSERSLHKRLLNADTNRPLRRRFGVLLLSRLFENGMLLNKCCFP